MKSFFFTSYFFIFCVININGQVARKIDLRVRILDPPNISIFYAPINLDVTYSVFNKGPDTIKAYDTFIIYGRNITNYPVKLSKVNRVIATQDSIILHYIMPLSYTGDNDYFWVSMLVHVYSWGPDSIRSETLEMQKDNTGIVRLLQRHSTNVKVLDLCKSVKFFPNPVSDILNIESLNGVIISNLKIYDVQGRLIKDADLSENQDDLQLDVSDLPVGIYQMVIKDTSSRNLVFRFVKI